MSEKDPPSGPTTTHLELRPDMTQMSESTRFQTNQYSGTFGQEEASKYTQPLPLRELLVLHQVLQVSSQEEEEQEDEKKEKRGDATLDDSHLTVHM